MSYRLYISDSIFLNKIIELSKDQNHYITNVLRLKDGDNFRVFNEKDGEFEVILIKFSKKKYQIQILEKKHSPVFQEKISIAISIIKGSRFFLALEKLCELGITNIYPIFCNRSQYRDMNLERARKCLIEASEQSNRFDIPKIHSVTSLDKFLANYDSKKIIICNENSNPEDNLLKLKSMINDKDLCFLIGPEGGFDLKELEKLSSLVNISLGKNILRAETAAISLISQIQLLRS